jgi:hypothetical protein
MNNNLWISWETHTRSRSISNALKIELVELLSNKHRIFKYIILTIRTIKVLFQKKPQVLIVQNPSIVLGYLSVFLRPLLRYKLIMDCHNAAIYPLEDEYLWMTSIAQFLIRKADFVIVTNDELSKKVIELKGSPIILNDPIPVFEFDEASQFQNLQPKVTLIATWAEDEPILEFLHAVKKVDNVDFYVTGKLKDPYIKEKYSTIHFPGFVSRTNYIKLIATSDLIVDLTTRENCLVCGAYEAVGVGVPMLLSNTISLRSTFDLGAEFCENTVDGIKDGIVSALSNINDLKVDIKEMKLAHMKRWETNSLILQKELNANG